MITDIVWTDDHQLLQELKLTIYVKTLTPRIKTLKNVFFILKKRLWQST